MKNLTLLKQEILEILKQLEFGCAQFELGGGGKENGSAKGVEISVNNIELTPLLKKAGGLDLVERFLQRNGLNFSTNFDIIKRPFKFPDGTITKKTVFGIIKGENIQSINTKIEELISELSSNGMMPKDENISIKKEDKLEAPTINIGAESRTEEEIITSIAEDGMGYFIFHGEKILIGEISTSKFRLIETLCNKGLQKGKTIDLVFDYIKVIKDKNKSDANLDSPYLARNRKLELINSQIREINRAITEHVKQKSLKKIKFRLKLKKDNNTVWIEEKVGRRG